MHHAIRKTTALIAILGAVGLAHAEGGPGDSGAGNPDPSASSASGVNHRMKAAKSGTGKTTKSHARRAASPASAASGM